MAESIRRPKFALGFVSAAIGGWLGYLAFNWIASKGFYALIVPSGLLGLAGGYGVRYRSVPFAIVCCIAGSALALFTEWRFAPFQADDSLFYFITHLHQKNQVSLLMLAICPIISYRLALGMDERPATKDSSA